ncbi:cyclic nucleotide-binding domain-containing protein [Streptomyces virginiae]|uniref:cyclic nucleotide-binding domain-containing protein n=1 Tax=Streptomyces virginiae TaxID=1961 RepID=UPI00352E1267
MNTLLDEMGPEAREALLAHAHRVDIPAGTRIFKERQRADRFWIIENGTVDLDLHVPGHKAAVIDTLGSGELLGWSWMVPPYAWHLGAVPTLSAHSNSTRWPYGSSAKRTRPWAVAYPPLLPQSSPVGSTRPAPGSSTCSHSTTATCPSPTPAEDQP